MANEDVQKTLAELSRDLQESKARLEEAQRVAHVGHWEWDLETDVVVWSDETYRIFGLTPQERPMDLATVRAMVHPEDRESLYGGVDEDLVAGVRPDAEFRIVLPSGEVRTVHALTSKRWNSMPGDSKRDASGRPYNLFGTVQDITERRRAEEALQRTQVDLREVTRELRRQQEYLTEAQSLTHVGSWACNFLTGQIFHLSDEAIRLYGLDPSSSGISFEILYKATHPEDEPTLREKFYDAIQARRDYDLEYRIYRPDGTVRFLRSLGHYNASHEVGEYVGITMDITERKHAEVERERLRQLEADLAHINRVNMMGELAAALAHEIKQPIAAAVANAGACLGFLDGQRPDILEAREAASGTIGCARRAAEIIDHVRSLFKKSFPEREPVDINELIREISLLLQNDMRRNSVTVRLELAGNLPEVAGDRVQLEQVLMNLMLNAIEAMQDANGDLTITSQPGDDGHLLISVSDTGIGIPADKVEQIFDTFFTTKAQGTGMGLGISRSIVESHGGRLWATSNSERGATFQFTLPQGGVGT